MANDSSDDPVLGELWDRPTLSVDRREFLGFIGAAVAASACGDVPDGSGSGGGSYPSIASDPRVESTPPPPAPALSDDPFQLGIASGDPDDDGFVLWTRLAPEPLDGGGMPDERVPVVWEIAADPDFRDIVGRNWSYAEPEWAHAVHVEVHGLEPDRDYWYRFHVGDQWSSEVGRTRTFPRPGASPDRLRMATASCQDYTAGFYNAHARLADEDVDLIAFLGDYIYEKGFGDDDSVRIHRGPTPETLDEFRQRYALYKSDSDLQAAHRSAPWILTWDDHEVSNNYAGWEEGTASIDDMKRLRANAYKAYFEHMPLRIPRPDGPSMRIYRGFQYGDLVSLHVLDGRQYRSGVICDGEVKKPCDEVFDEDETMLGDDQRRWLIDRLRRSDAVWDAVCQQTVLTPVNLDNQIVNPDMWDGYQAERQRVLDAFADDPSNVVVLTGDIHSHGLARIPGDDDRPKEAETVGHEIVATSITSGNSQLGSAGDLTHTIQLQAPYVKYLDPSDRGYCIVEYTRDRCTVEYRIVSTVTSRDADLETDRAFEIDAETEDLRDLET